MLQTSEGAAAFPRVSSVCRVPRTSRRRGRGGRLSPPLSAAVCVPAPLQPLARALSRPPVQGPRAGGAAHDDHVGRPSPRAACARRQKCAPAPRLSHRRLSRRPAWAGWAQRLRGASHTRHRPPPRHTSCAPPAHLGRNSYAPPGLRARQGCTRGGGRRRSGSTSPFAARRTRTMPRVRAARWRAVGSMGLCSWSPARRRRRQQWRRPRLWRWWPRRHRRSCPSGYGRRHGSPPTLWCPCRRDSRRDSALQRTPVTSTARASAAISRPTKCTHIGWTPPRAMPHA